VAIYKNGRIRGFINLHRPHYFRSWMIANLELVEQGLLIGYSTPSIQLESMNRALLTGHGCKA
jgi:hypothetical protein